MIGHPVRHSLSPVIQNAAFAAAELDWVFVALDVAPGRGASAVEAMRAVGIDGLSVTMPHKADVAGAVDLLAPGAAALGVVNCVQRAGDRLIGHNTDGDGFVSALLAETGKEPTGLSCLVIGGGGAARAVVEGLGRHGAARVAVANRTDSRAREAAALAGAVGELTTADRSGEFDLVVNATSVGMAGTGTDGEVPLNPDLVGAGQIVADLVYNPIETPLLAAARRNGAAVVDGVGMLVGQAALAFELWTGVTAPSTQMTAAARASLASLR